MNLLLRQPTIIDPSSPFHLQKADILISNGIIQEIAPAISQDNAQLVNAEGLSVSPGWVDLFAQFCDPGLEFRETLETGAAAAAAGGYTDVLVLPDTAPVVHGKQAVEYLVQRSRNLPVTIHPIGAITRAMEGKDLAEMYDMEASGAAAFSDGLKPVQSAGLLVKALQYVKAVNKTIIQLPDDQTVNPGGLMNEGIISTGLGLPGRPSIAEELMVARDISLLRYTGSRLHLTGISTAASLELVRQAKAEGLQLTCSVTPYHLTWCEDDLQQYDTNLKVNPPLRTAIDRAALLAGVLDGTVDCIAAHHNPHDTDGKVVEFEYAKNGMIGLQTSFAAVCTALPDISLERLVQIFATAPRSIFGLPAAGLRVKEKASMTLFSNKTSWSFEKAHNRSRSANSPFFGHPLVGKPAGIIHKGLVFLNEY